MQKSHILLLGLFLLTSNLFGQVVIKEKINLNPNPKISEQQYLGDTIDILNPIYLNYGGEVVMYLENLPYGSGSYELWEESLGRLEGGTAGYNDTLNLGVFDQWRKFVFYIYDPLTGQKYYNEVTADLYLGYPGASSFQTEVSFYPSHQQGDPYPISPDFSWIMRLDVDTSLATMPTQEIMDLPGNSNPFLPNGDINIPVNGDVYAVINYVNTTASIDLSTDLPNAGLLKGEVQNYVGDTLWLGQKIAGDQIRFYIKSTHSIVNGMKLYADGLWDGEYQNENGEIFLGNLDFEDWTDLYFENLEIKVYMHPDSLTSFPTPVIVEVRPDEIAPGDTAEISLLGRYDDGSISSFDANQVFDVQIIKGGEYGTLYTPAYNFSSDELYGIPQGFSFIAADSIDTDSAKVTILVKAYTGIIISSAIQYSGNNKLFSQSNNGRLSLNKFSGTEYKNSGRPVSGAANGNNRILKDLAIGSGALVYGPPIGFGEIKVIGKTPKLVIISPTKTTPPDTITAEPKMPKIICKVKLNNYDNKPYLLKWEYIISYNLPRRYRASPQSSYIDLCERYARVAIIDTTKGDGPNINSWTVPFNKNKIGAILFKAKQPDISIWAKYGGDCGEIISEWNEGQEIFIGGRVHLKVTAFDSLGIGISGDSLDANRILGSNPSIDSIYKYVNSNEIKAILVAESKTEQFENSSLVWPYNIENSLYYGNGWPIYGYPNGYGLMQLDNPAPTEKMLWNWKTNVDNGAQLFNNKKSIAKNFLEKHGSDSYSQNQLLVEAFQRYNGGSYWQWSKENGKSMWIAKNTENYGKKTYEIYKNLK